MLNIVSKNLKTKLKLTNSNLNVNQPEKMKKSFL